MKRLFIIHFSPLELYPPVQNLLEFADKELNNKIRISVFTTNSSVKELNKLALQNSRFKIIRLGVSAVKLNKFKRYWSYLKFNLVTLFYLVALRPKTVLYYETISSYPVYLYKRYFNSKAKIFIHYHEYNSIHEYETGMILIKYFHSCEKKLYSKVNWLSHTNDYRMQLFVSDIKPLTIANPKIIPNNPSKKWATTKKKIIARPIRIIYIGSLSIDTMYTMEFAEWVLTQNGKVIWDIYSFNITEQAREYLETMNSDWINIKAGINYNELPSILNCYDIGLVLYKGHLPNYIYNIPNKLNEYAVCGLDVWFPNKMIGSLGLLTSYTYPKIIALDFDNLKKMDLYEICNRKKLIYKAHTSCYEESLREIVGELNLFER